MKPTAVPLTCQFKVDIKTITIITSIRYYALCDWLTWRSVFLSTDRLTSRFVFPGGGLPYETDGDARRLA